MIRVPNKARKVIFILSITLLICFIAVFYIYQVTRGSSVNFQQYEPANLPGDMRITERNIEIWNKKTGFLSYKKILRFGFSDPGFTVGQQRDTGFVYECDSLVPDNATCSIEETPKHQRYRIVTSRHQVDELFTQDVSLLKSDTHIFMTVKGNPLRPYSIETWSSIIDSLVPTEYETLHVTHHSYGP